MIGNVIAVGRSFSDNIAYNMLGSKAKPNPDKCAWYETRNLVTDDLDACGRIMQATAAHSRTYKPVFHFSLDWHPSEADTLTRDTVTEAADHVINRLGLSEHQAIYFWHVDADHPHLHVVVNRLGDTPEPAPAWDVWKSKEGLERACYETAQELNFMQVAGKHNQLDHQLEGGNWQERDAYQQAAHQDEAEPLLWDKDDLANVRDQVADHFRETENWLELEQSLAESGLELRTKGQGLIVTDGEQYAKLSSLGKDIRLRGDDGLEQRFGQSWRDYEAQTDPALRPCYQSKRLDQELQRLAHTIDHTIGSDVSTPSALSLCDMRIQNLALCIHANQQFETLGTLHQAATKLAAAHRHAKRQEWCRDRAKDLIVLHQTKYRELLAGIFRHPRLAQRKLKQIHRQRDLRAMIDLLTRQPDWRWWFATWLRSNRRSRVAGAPRARQRQLRFILEQRLFYRAHKLREAEARLFDRERGLADARAILRTAQTTHARQQQIARRLRRHQTAAAQQVTSQLLKRAPLPQPVKSSLLEVMQCTTSEQRSRRPVEPSRRRGVDRSSD